MTRRGRCGGASLGKLAVIAALLFSSSAYTVEATKVRAHAVQSKVTQKTAKRPVEENLLQLSQSSKQKEKGKSKQEKAPDAAKPDDIALSSNEDMFAFSQIIAGGQKVAQVTAAIEKEQKAQAEKPDDEDNAILAFSNSLPGNDGAPVEVVEDPNKKKAEDQAAAELAELYNNPATAAFANMVSPQSVSLAQTGSSSQVESKSTSKVESESGSESVQGVKLLKMLQNNMQGIVNNPQAVAKLAQLAPALQQVAASTPMPMPTPQIATLAQAPDSTQKLNFSPEQLQYLKQMVAAPQAMVQSSPAPAQVQAANLAQQIQSIAPIPEVPVVQAPTQLIQHDESTDTQPTVEVSDLKSKTPIDKVEKDSQPADNDDDEKLADNHRKMAKIDLKKEEIKKLLDTHQALTQDAVKQAKTGASMKRVQHNLQIAKSVAKRVEDLKQQVVSDQRQLQKIANPVELDQILPFKKDESQSEHENVAHIPSVKDSSTGERHSVDLLGNLVATKAQGMEAADESAYAAEAKQRKQKRLEHRKAYSREMKKAQKQMKAVQDAISQMSREQKEFQVKQAAEVKSMMTDFQTGFTALESAKDEEMSAESIEDEADDTQQVAVVQDAAVKDAPTPSSTSDEPVSTVSSQNLEKRKANAMPTSLAQTSSAQSSTQNVQQQTQQEADLLNQGQALATQQQAPAQPAGQPDELQQDMAQLIAQAQSAGLPTPPADNTMTQVQDQASLDAQASTTAAQDQIQSLMSKISQLTGGADPAQAIAAMQAQTTQKAS